MGFNKVASKVIICSYAKYVNHYTNNKEKLSCVVQVIVVSISISVMML